MVTDEDDFKLPPAAKGWVGRSIPRFEDAALVAGRGRYLDDLGVSPGTLEAAILRSPHAHAEIESIDCIAAQAADGVVAVVTGSDIKALTSSLVVGVKAAIECWPIARGSGLADFKRPRRYIFVAEIPRSPVGKLLRRKLVAGDFRPEQGTTTQ